MKIIEIITQKNGSHNNADEAIMCPAGWAVIPDGTETPNFPFGTFDVETVNGVPTMKNWVAGTMPEPEPTEPDPVTQAQIALAELAETESAHDIENKLALAELAETIGGTSNG